MTNTHQIEGQWDQIKGQIRQEWADMNDDELELGRGNREELVGKIKQKYGDSKEAISDKLDRIMAKVH